MDPDQPLLQIGSTPVSFLSLLTAAAVVAGAFIILFDPIFQGLAISLMAGEIASLLLSLTVVLADGRVVRTSRRSRSAGSARRCSRSTTRRTGRTSTSAAGRPIPTPCRLRYASMAHRLVWPSMVMPIVC